MLEQFHVDTRYLVLGKMKLETFKGFFAKIIINDDYLRII